MLTSSTAFVNPILASHQNNVRQLIQSKDDIFGLSNYQVTLAVDTEYVQQPDNPNRMITSQVAYGKEGESCIVLEHPVLGLGLLESWKGQTIFSTVIGWEEVDKPDKLSGYLTIELLMFFAPSDLLAGCFRDIQIQRDIQKVCKQDARIRVETTDKKHPNLLQLPIYLQSPYGVLQLVLKVVDMGKVAIGGLKDVVVGLGGQMTNKSSMDIYKTNMLEPYSSNDINLFNQFIEYGKEDSNVLFTLRSLSKQRTSELFAVHSLNIPTNKNGVVKEFLTTGALVASLLLTYIEKTIKDNDASSFFHYKGLKKDNEKSWELEQLLARSTVSYFAKKEETDKALLAIVQGGRAKRELPLLLSHSGVIADIDISGAYASAMSILSFPVGLPVVYGQHETGKRRMTVGEFLKKNDDELLDRCWSITASGSLSHRQTLIFSKIVDRIDIVENYSEDDPKIEADMRLYTKEISKGILTSDIIEILKNVSTDKEFSEYMKLNVDAAIYYPKSLRCSTAAEWYQKTEEHCELFGNSIEEIVAPSGKTIITDNRSHYWLDVPLNDFLAPYKEKRTEYKDAMKKLTRGTPDYIALDAKQTMMKLVANTLYGTIASPYFSTGNVMVANNITAIIRSVAWLMSVGLGCSLIATDGGSYDMNKVRYKTGKLSMNTFSSLRDLSLLSVNTRKLIVEKPLTSDTVWTVSEGKTILGDKDGEKDCYSIVSNGLVSVEQKEGGWNHFDNLALEHLRDFFKSENPISILDYIRFEHKDMFMSATYHSQANYQFESANSQMTLKTKARGHKIKPGAYMGEDGNILKLFQDLKNPRAVPSYKPQYISTVLKCNQANEMLLSKKPTSENLYFQNNLTAGDSILKRSWLRPLSLSMFHWETDKQYSAWSKAVESLKRLSGYGLEQYFLNSDGETFDYIRAVETIQAAIDEGRDWLKPANGRGNKKGEIVATHPALSPTIPTPS